MTSKDYSFTDVWDVISYGNAIFFRSKYYIFQLNIQNSNNTITVHPAPFEWRFLGLSNGRIIAQDLKNGLLEYKNGVWASVSSTDILPYDFLVKAFVP